MMNIRKATLFLAILFLLLAFNVRAVSRSADSIIVNDADEVRETSVSMAQNLGGLIAEVEPRIVLQHGNQLRHIGLAAVPSSFQTLLDQVSAKVIVQYANTIRSDGIPPMPGALQTLLGQVSDRIVLQYAKANRQESLVYPVALFNDTTPPQVSGITVRQTGSGSVTISWTTDEFASSTVIYGTQPGVYPHTVGNPLYTKQHAIPLTGLTPGTTYYYKVRSTDRSDNTATSAEHSFTAQLYVYLPLVKRNY